jgi:hypothetical protein
MALMPRIPNGWLDGEEGPSPLSDAAPSADEADMFTTGNLMDHYKRR